MPLKLDSHSHLPRAVAAEFIGPLGRDPAKRRAGQVEYRIGGVRVIGKVGEGSSDPGLDALGDGAIP
jgi:hypothetical protein